MVKNVLNAVDFVMMEQAAYLVNAFVPFVFQMLLTSIALIAAELQLVDDAFVQDDHIIQLEVLIDNMMYLAYTDDTVLDRFLVDSNLIDMLVNICLKNKNTINIHSFLIQCIVEANIKNDKHNLKSLRTKKH